MAEFKMPSLGADMEAGTLVEWHVKPGDTVERGDVVAIVDTHKGAIDVEIFETGTVEKLVVEPGQKVPVGTVLAIVRAAGEETVAPATEAEAPTPTQPPPAAPAPGLAAPPAQPAAVAERPERARVSPVARKRAAELGVDIARVTGTGPGGTITLTDVENAASAEAPPPEKASRFDKTAMRQAIAAAMARSKREIPHYYLGTTIDMGRALDWLTSENEKRPITERLLYAVLPLKAVALALREAPELNGFWLEGAFRPSRTVHAGVAIAVRGGGLIAPAIHDADQKPLNRLMQDLRDLVQRTRAGSLRSSELADATITVTNLGEEGVDRVYGVIYPPQVAIVGLGRIAERPWSVDGKVQSRPLMEATLAADHRVSDGRRGGQFLALLERLLQEPEKL